MNRFHTHKGFTLVEVLLAAGILVIGLILVAGAFPLGIKMTTVSTERTVGTVVADEAIAKIRLLIDPNDAGQDYYGIDTSVLDSLETPVYDLGELFVSFQDSTPLLYQGVVSDVDLTWPSVDTEDDKYYYWSALLKYAMPTTGKGYPTDLDAVVFISRITGLGAEYPDPANPSLRINIPKPVIVPVDTAASDGTKIVVMDDSTTPFDERDYFDHIVEDAVLIMTENNPPLTSPLTASAHDTMVLIVKKLNPVDYTITLDNPIDAAQVNSFFWFVPTSYNSSRNPCIGVYQERIPF